MQCTSNFIQEFMQEERFDKLNITIKHALRDCFAKHPEWFAGGNMQAIERWVLRTLKPNLLNVLQLRFGDGVLECMYRSAQPNQREGE